MLNQLALVGILEKINRLDDFFYEIILEVPRNFKEINGGFKSDHLCVKVWKGAADSLMSENSLGMLVSISGRVETNDEKILLVGEKLDYIGRSSKFKRR